MPMAAAAAAFHKEKEEALACIGERKKEKRWKRKEKKAAAADRQSLLLGDWREGGREFVQSLFPMWRADWWLRSSRKRKKSDEKLGKGFPLAAGG